MVRLMHGECGSSELFMKYLIESSMRVQAALVDQLFNSSEKRLARIMLMMAEYGESGEPIEFIPTISQEMRAGMIGTTRSRVSFFINCFRNLGFIEYKDRIRVHKSLLNVILHDRPSERNAKAPPLVRSRHLASPKRTIRCSKSSSCPPIPHRYLLPAD
jgi:hypothetical protein